MQFDLYRPELHYMRGPGPKWHAKQERAFASLDKTANARAVRDSNNEARRNANLSVKRGQSVMLRTLKNWRCDDVSASLDSASSRCVFGQSQVRAGFVVVERI